MPRPSLAAASGAPSHASHAWLAANGSLGTCPKLSDPSPEVWMGRGCATVKLSASTLPAIAVTHCFASRLSIGSGVSRPL